MKKLVAVMMVLALVLSLCACGSGSAVAGSISPAEETGGVSGTVTQTPEPTPEPTQEPEEDIEPGNQVGGRYENKFLGIGCELDENWTYATQEELAAMIGQTAELFTEYAEQIKNADMFYDMMAVADDGLVSINVVFENLGMLYGSMLSEEQYLDITGENLEEQFLSAGFENIEWERISIDFAGAEHAGFHLSCTVQDVPYYCTQVCMKVGHYMAGISFCSFIEDVGEDLMANFFAL